MLACQFRSVRRESLLAAAALNLVLCGCDQAKPNALVDSASATPSTAPPPRPAAKLLEPGDRAPSFSLLAHTGMQVAPERFASKRLALLFCPALTSQTCSNALTVLRDSWLRLRPKLGMVIAVLPEDRIRLREYAYAQELPMLLASDLGATVSRAYGVGLAGSTAVQLFLLAPDMKVTTRLPEPDRDSLSRWIDAL